jgi:hypothetical protein
MSGTDWSREEVEAIIDDYLAMLAAELAGVRYNKAAHRRDLLPRLADRSEQSGEFKHANISGDQQSCIQPRNSLIECASNDAY